MALLEAIHGKHREALGRTRDGHYDLLLAAQGADESIDLRLRRRIVLGGRGLSYGVEHRRYLVAEAVEDVARLRQRALVARGQRRRDYGSGRHSLSPCCIVLLEVFI